MPRIDPRLILVTAVDVAFIPGVARTASDTNPERTEAIKEASSPNIPTKTRIFLVRLRSVNEVIPSSKPSAISREPVTLTIPPRVGGR